MLKKLKCWIVETWNVRFIIEINCGASTFQHFNIFSFFNFSTFQHFNFLLQMQSWSCRPFKVDMLKKLKSARFRTQSRRMVWIRSRWARLAWYSTRSDPPEGMLPICLLDSKTTLKVKKKLGIREIRKNLGKSLIVPTAAGWPLRATYGGPSLKNCLSPGVSGSGGGNTFEWSENTRSPFILLDPHTTGKFKIVRPPDLLLF